MKLQIRTSTFVILSLFVLSAAGVSPARGQATRPRYSSSGGGGGLTVPENTIISVRMNTSLSSRSARVGDKFTGTVDVPVRVNGDTAIPAGATVEGRVTQVTPAKRMNRSGTLAIDFDQIIMPDGSAQHVVGTLTSADPYTRRKIDDESRVGADRGKNPVIFIGGSGALGAILGGITGGAKGAAVGGVIGAGAGVASILLQKGVEAEVPAGTPFGIQLRQPLFVQGSYSSGDPQGVIGGNQDPNDPRDQYGRSNSGSGDPNSGGRPTYRRRDRDSSQSDPADVGPEDRSGRTSDPDPSYRRKTPDNNQPRHDQPDESTEDRRRPADTSNEPPASDPGPAAEPEPPLSLSSPEAIRRAQVALKEQGYYEGQADGAMNPRTAGALKVFQREHKLPETGDLDEATARGLGIIGGAPTPSGSGSGSRSTSRSDSDRRVSSREPESRGDNVVAATVSGASARRLSDGSIYVSIDTQANTGGWRWQEEHSVNGNTLEVFAKGVRPAGMVTQVLTRGRIEVTVRDDVDSVDQVVIHSAGADRTVQIAGGGSSRGATTTDRSSRGTGDRSVGGSAQPISSSRIGSLQRQAEDLFVRYEQLSGVRLTSNGSVEVDRNRRSGDPEIELLFALDGFVKSVQLYGRVAPTLTDSNQIRQATVAMARQARVTDRIISTSQSRLARELTDGWEAIRQTVLAFMQSQRITTAEIEP